MHLIKDETLELINVNNFTLQSHEKGIQCTVLINYTETFKDDTVFIVAYDSLGNKYNASQSIKDSENNKPLFARKTAPKALQIASNSVVNFNDYKRAKEERTATKKEKFLEGFQQFKQVASTQMEKLFNV